MRPRLAAAALSAAGFAVLAATSALAADRLAPLLGAVGAAGLALLVLALAGRLPGAVPWALALLGAEYVALVYAGGDGRLFPFAAGGFVLVAELAYWALEPPSAESALRRSAAVAAAAVAGGAAAALVASIGNEDVVGGLGVEAAGIGATVLLVAVVLVLTHLRTSG
jgi:hypothetical protein